MASPFQQRSLQRKLIYLGIILVLFTGSYLFMHQSFTVPVFGWEFKSVIAQAEELALREQNIGDVELSGAAVRLNLTGLRGLAVCVLWNTAIEKQKKNQWNELEIIVDSVTKLQPHFITPWLFQSWNLAYNVSVESDREADQYFYITRGIELLARGERQNHNNPDLRFAMGFYNQNKIGQSDKTNVMRCLYQMSSIPPNERDAARFQSLDDKGQVTIDLREFEDFCKNHPQLVRRLRDELKLNKPELIVQFLDENYTVPTMYEETKKAVPGAWRKTEGKLLPIPSRFPMLPPARVVLPPQQAFDPDEITAEQPDRLKDDFNAFACARAWFGYAQEPLPPTGEFPGQDDKITDRTKQRRPKFTTAIFRNYPARAQSYVAENLEQEGWFDDKGWLITDWFLWTDASGARREQFEKGEPPVVGADHDWAKDAWTRAHAMWKEHGERNKLYLTALEAANLENESLFYRQEYGVEIGAPPVPLEFAREQSRAADERERMIKSLHAFVYSHWYHRYRTLTNFEHFYLRSQIEMDEKTIAARKAFFEGRQLYRLGRRLEALEKYEAPGALAYWRDLLFNEKFGSDPEVEDYSYIVQLRYLRTVNETIGQDLKQAQAIYAFLGEAAGSVAPSWINIQQLHGPFLMPQPAITGPFDGNSKNGRAMISDEARNSVNTRFGIGGRPQAEPPTRLKPPSPVPAP
jgi:hypothetical protein